MIILRRGTKFVLAVSALVLPLLPSVARAQTVERLWGNRLAPSSTGTTMTDTVNNPYLQIFAVSADSATGTAMVILPGGGYEHLSGIREGRNVARWFNKKGISAFVLRYRLGTSSGAGYHHPVQMWDGQRAVRWVRANAKRFNIDTARVGIVGFSAGGHLASTVATHWDAGNPDSASQYYYTGSKDSVDGYSSRPSFQILVYPVINMDSSITHAGSKKALLGNSPTATVLRYLSNERQVRANTPPAFIVHTQSDATVLIQNSYSYADSLLRYGVRRQLRVFPTGAHGFGLADGQDAAPSYTDVATWPTLASSWLDSVGMLYPVRVKGAIPAKRAPGKSGLSLNGTSVEVRSLANPSDAAEARDLRGRTPFALPASR